MGVFDLLNLIDEIIIDNTTNQVSPFKVRQVLKAIVNEIKQTNSVSMTAQSPVIYDPFENKISITKADLTHDGYLSKEDWALFYAVAGFIPYNVPERIKKGYGNDLPANQTGDIFRLWNNDGTIFIDSAVYLGGDMSDSDNFKPLVQTGVT